VVWNSRMWALSIVALYVAGIAFVGFTALGYERRLDGMAEDLPALAAWTFHAHHYTPLFFILAIPAILCAITNRLSARERLVAMTISGAGLLWLVVWFGVIWLGMGFLIRKMEAVIS